MPPGSPARGDPSSTLYQVGLGLVAVTMIILPCIYVTLTALACYGVYYFATHHFGAIWEWPIGTSQVGILVKVVCSFTPLLAGSAIGLFMIKPIFARRAARMQPLALDPTVEPRVYEFVQTICKMVGAPSPRRIEVNCDLNASARFDRGIRGFVAGDLILTLGMPLIAGLTQRELGGVIAHEFGHFRQGAGMRVSYLIRRVNGWFARVVYERDAWDETIESWATCEEGWLVFMISCVRFAVWFSRRVLWVLMMLGHAISSFLLRQMEYDADRAEIRIAGSAAFESTMLKLAALESTLADIHREMRRVWRTRMQLPDNLPVLVEYRAARISPEERSKLENSVGLSKTTWLDTHPSAADRVRCARRLAEPGLALGEDAARVLFENFDTVSRLVTLAHYEDDLNVPTSADFLIPLEQLVREQINIPPARPAAPAVPMMAYQPEAFRAPRPRE